MLDLITQVCMIAATFMTGRKRRRRIKSGRREETTSRQEGKLKNKLDSHECKLDLALRRREYQRRNSKG